MPVIDFPSSPSNNELFIAQGKAMRYNSDKNKWRQVTTLTSNQITELEGKTIGISSMSISGNTLVIQKDDSTHANVSLSAFAGNILTNYASASQLPTTGLVAGSQVYVTDTDSLFITDGSGWYKIATVNLSPSLSLGVSSISLGAGGSVDINYTITEPEDTPFTITASATSSASITVHQANNTITFDNPTVATSETITISATDGVNTVADTLTMTISLGPDWSTGGNYKLLVGATSIDLGTGLFPSNRIYTAECWVQVCGQFGQQVRVFQQYSGATGRTIHGFQNDLLSSFIGGDGSWHNTTTSVFNDIAHYAWVSNGDGTVSMWKNGIFAGSANQGGSSSPPAGASTLLGNGIDMVMYGFRINSNALYTGTGNFTPPALDGGLTNVAGTIALWDGKSSTLTDASGNQTFTGTTTIIQSNLRDILNGADANKSVTGVRKYGYGVEMDGANNRLAISDPSANYGLGLVDIYELENERWVYKQSIHGPPEGEGAGGAPSNDSQLFGQDISLRGDYLAVGAPYADEGTWQGYGEFPSQAYTGAVYVYYRSGGTWSLQQKIKRIDLSHSKRFDHLGTQVHLMDDNGTGLICYNQHNYNGTYTGSSGDAAKGQIHYVTRSGTTWSEATPLGSSNAFRPTNHHDLTSQRWGTRLDGDANGDRIITSSYRSGGMGTPTNSGRVFIFTRSGTTFTEEVELAEPTPTLNSRFGSQVAINAAGDECAISAHGATVGSTTRVGAVYIYTRSGSTWSLQQKVTMSGTPIAETNFGGKDDDGSPLCQMRLVGDYLYVTAEKDDGHFEDAGALYVFKRSGTTWSQQAKIYANTGASGSSLHKQQTLGAIGASESLPNYLVVGAPAARGFDLTNATKGKVFVFKVDG